MSTPALILKEHMKTLGLVGAPGEQWAGHVGMMPPAPDDAVCFYDIAGFKSGRYMSGRTITHPGIQIRVRGRSYPDAYEKIETLANKCDEVFDTSVQVKGVPYVIESITQTTTIFSLGVQGQDTDKLANLTLNLHSTIRKDDAVSIGMPISLTIELE